MKKSLPCMEKATRTKTTRRSTMMIKVIAGCTYVWVSSARKSTQTRIAGVRSKRKEDLLIEIRGDSNKKVFTTEVTEKVVSMEEVQFVNCWVNLEIRDSDC